MCSFYPRRDFVYVFTMHLNLLNSQLREMCVMNATPCLD